MGSIQRGGMIRRNDNGTLERVDGTNTYIGSATLENGKVITKRFRCVGFKEDEVADRWLKWQSKAAEKMAEKREEQEARKNEDKENPMAEKKVNCPISDNVCGPTCPMWSEVHGRCALYLGGIGMYNVASNLMKLKVDQELELIAMAIADSARTDDSKHVGGKTDETGVIAYLDGKRFLEFVNLHSKSVHAEYRKFCKANGYPEVSESELTSAIKRRYKELKAETSMGGTRFIAA